MIKLTTDNLTKVLNYMEEDLVNCLYLYGDIVRYGLENPNMTVWYSENNGVINAVFMKYFTGSHIYSKNLDYNVDEIIEKVREVKPDRISAQREIIERIYPSIEETYDAEYGCIFKLSSFRKLKSPVPIEKATAEDAKGIAELMMTHELYAASYREEALAEELADRIENGIGRSYIIRDNDRIVAHDSVTLETDKYAIEGLAIVHEDFRNTLYGAFLDSYMINDLGREGKDLYCMIIEGRRLDAFVRLGNEVLANYGKLFRKNNSLEI